MASSSKYTDERFDANHARRVVAMALANARSGVGGPFAALVVKGGDVISTGTNTVTTTQDPTAHAEVVAIRNACRALGSHQLDGCDLYCSCEPCPMCLGAIYWSRPRRVFFAATRHDATVGGFDDEMIYQELKVDPAERKIPMIHLSVDGAADVFKVWNDLPDKTCY